MLENSYIKCFSNLLPCYLIPNYHILTVLFIYVKISIWKLKIEFARHISSYFNWYKRNIKMNVKLTEQLLFYRNWTVINRHFTFFTISINLKTFVFRHFNLQSNYSLENKVTAIRNRIQNVILSERFGRLAFILIWQRSKVKFNFNLKIKLGICV